MKKVALMCAILGISVGFVACSDDDNDSSKKAANGEACKVAADCESGHCGEDGKCADKPAVDDDACKDKNAGDDCGDNKVCKADGDKLVCADKVDEPVVDDACKDKNAGDDCGDNKVCKADGDKLVCADKVDEPVVDGCTSDADCEEDYPKCDVDAMKCYKVNDSYTPVCENKDNKTTAYTAEWNYSDGSESKIIAEVCEGEKSDCNAGVGCVAPTGDLECSMDSDCTTEGKPYCVKNVCVAEKPATVDPCEGVTCTAGSCVLGICVTDDMKALEAGSYCNTDQFNDFCNNGKLYECAGNKIYITDCAETNNGTCTTLENYGKYIGICSNNEQAKKICNENKDADEVEVCYGGEDWIAKAMCVQDSTGNLAVYSHGMAKNCNGTPCSYDASGKPTCGKATE